MGKKILASGGLVLSIIYLINPGSGLIEIIPDVLPWIGNLDEATATGILIWSAKELFGKKKKKNPDILDEQT